MFLTLPLVFFLFTTFGIPNVVAAGSVIVDDLEGSGLRPPRRGRAGRGAVVWPTGFSFAPYVVHYESFGELTVLIQHISHYALRDLLDGFRPGDPRGPTRSRGLSVSPFRSEFISFTSDFSCRGFELLDTLSQCPKLVVLHHVLERIFPASSLLPFALGSRQRRYWFDINILTGLERLFGLVG